MGNPLGDSVMAKVPSYLPQLPVSTDGTFVSAKLVPQPPSLIASNGAAVDAYNSAKAGGIKARIINLQNLTTTPVKYALNVTSTTAVFHGVLPACTGAADGTSAMKSFDVERLGIIQISLFSAATISVATEIYTEQT